MRLTLFPILLGLFVFTGCGKKVTKEGKRTYPISENQISAIVANQVVECASISGEPCPEGIARLVIIDPQDSEESAVCSGFMIGPDKLVTNNHCVATEAQCRNTYIFIYNGNGYEKRKCAKLIETTIDFKNPADPRKKIDVSVLGLDISFAGRSFRSSPKKPEQGENLTTWVIDQTGLDRTYPNLFESRITEFHCVSGKRNKNRSLMLKNCPVIHGNSGSPVLDSEGLVVGLLWGATASEDVTTRMELSGRRLLNENAAVTEVEYFLKHFIP